ncbi:MAG TPA: ATP synthase F0 subunit C [Candidatus Margulisiibacteriota bacterium]|nr:ATP synthase F0 subunit C [Candidatus Margulisiibacteriota bacterium]
MSRNLAIILIFALCILGPSAVFAASSFASINALGRNPSSAPKIFTAMIIALVFAQTLAIIAMLVAFQLFSS